MAAAIQFQVGDKCLVPVPGEQECYYNGEVSSAIKSNGCHMVCHMTCHMTITCNMYDDVICYFCRCIFLMWENSKSNMYLLHMFMHLYYVKTLKKDALINKNTIPNTLCTYIEIWAPPIS